MTGSLPGSSAFMGGRWLRKGFRMAVASRVAVTGSCCGQARHHWQQALTLYTQLGAPEADQVRSELSALEAKAPE